MNYKICQKCKNIVEMVKENSNLLTCCGEKMEDLVPNTKEAAVEKHIPVYELKDNTIKVTVGEVLHPMQEVHYIMWIAIKTTNGMQRKDLNCNGKPEATFSLLENEKVEEIYAYCNLHGLWKKEIK